METSVIRKGGVSAEICQIGRYNKTQGPQRLRLAHKNFMLQPIRILLPRGRHGAWSIWGQQACSTWLNAVSRNRRIGAEIALITVIDLKLYCVSKFRRDPAKEFYPNTVIAPAIISSLILNAEPGL